MLPIKDGRYPKKLHQKQIQFFIRCHTEMVEAIVTVFWACELHHGS